MGKKLTQQRRGTGSPAYKTPGHRYLANVSYPAYVRQQQTYGQVTNILDDVGRTALVAEVLLEDGRKFYNVAAEGVAIGDKVDVGTATSLPGSITKLSNIPEGTKVYNVELHPGDGGRLSRASGATALIVTHDEETNKVNLQLPSKRVVTLSPECLATVGIASAGGRTDKPFKKAGNKRKAMHARNRLYPVVRGTAMNAVNHPHGGRSFGKPTTVSRNAPPGRKVGHIAARATGRGGKARKNA